MIVTETNCMRHATTLVIDFEGHDILKFIRALGIKKVHSHGNTSRRMIETCVSSIAKPMSIIFRKSLNSATFSDNWKRSNSVSV